MGAFDPPYVADERTMLDAWLRYQRESIVTKIDGVDDKQARWVPAPTANSLIGIVHHLVYVEWWWFCGVLAGERPSRPDWASKEDPDWDFHPPSEMSVTDVVASYRDACARSDEIAAAATLETTGTHPREGDVSLRWILVHMIEETARHAGHMDITRELIDGSTGML